MKKLTLLLLVMALATLAHADEDNTIDLLVSMQWQDNDNALGSRPDVVALTLEQTNGGGAGLSAVSCVMRAADLWKTTVKNVSPATYHISTNAANYRLLYDTYVIMDMGEKKIAAKAVSKADEYVEPEPGDDDDDDDENAEDDTEDGPLTLRLKLTLVYDSSLAVEPISADDGSADADWFSLAGVRLPATPATKGVYISRGKKFVVR